MPICPADGGKMIQYLEAKEDIARAQRKLSVTIRRGFSQVAIKDIGHPGGRERDARVATDGRYWFWSTDLRSSKSSNPRRLNWFGVLGEKSGVSITVEVNTAYEDRNNQTAGFFGRDTDTGIVYLLHSGRVGGGAHGVGKDSFLTWAALAKHTLVEVVDSSGNKRDGLVVMPIEGIAACRSAIRYIELVRKFKIAARNGLTLTTKFRREQRKFEDYFAEGRGRRTGRRRSKIDYISRHGDIVDALHVWRKSRRMPKQSHVVKNVLIDLGVSRGKKLIEVFEVKPKADRSSVYSALGQLMVHGVHNACRKVLVLPQNEALPSDLAGALRRLRIEVLRFRLDSNAVVILGR
jgi:hypothetical protein